MGQLLEWFRDSGFANFVNALLSVVAVIISIIALRKSHKTQGRLVDIETARERDRLSKARKAALVGEIVSDDGAVSGHLTTYFLVIAKRGEAEAWDIEISLDGHPFREHPAAREEFQVPKRLGPASKVRYPLAYGGRPPFDCELTWQDDSGEPGIYRSTLTR